MKRLWLVIMLIGMPLPALAVCNTADPQNMCAREAAQLAKAHAIKDEDVLNFPVNIGDVDAECSESYEPNGSKNTCIDRTQSYYDIGKFLWDGISLNGRKECLLLAREYSRGYQFYVRLGSCLEFKKTAAERPHTFNPY